MGVWLARLVIVDGRVSNTCTPCICVAGKLVNKGHYYMARYSRGESERSDCFFLGQDFVIWTFSVEMVISCVFSAFESLQIQNKHGPSAI